MLIFAQYALYFKCFFTESREKRSRLDQPEKLLLLNIKPTYLFVRAIIFK